MISATPTWVQAMKKFEVSHRGRALWQLANTVLPYIGLWALMVLTVVKGLPYWATLALAVPAAGLLVRIFIFFHDCCHGSFFASQRANRVIGTLAGIVTFTPFAEFRYTHGVHHSTAGDLDRRGIGDIWTMTVAEYRAAPLRTRIAYRLYRNPLVMFLLGPIATFLILNRFPKSLKAKQVASVLLTDDGASSRSPQASAWPSDGRPISRYNSRSYSSAASEVSGSSTSSTSSTRHTGRATRSGARSPRPCRAAPITACHGCSSG